MQYAQKSRFLSTLSYSLTSWFLSAFSQNELGLFLNSTSFPALSLILQYFYSPAPPLKHTASSTAERRRGWCCQWGDLAGLGKTQKGWSMSRRWWMNKRRSTKGVFVQAYGEKRFQQATLWGELSQWKVVREDTAEASALAWWTVKCAKDFRCCSKYSKYPPRF